MSRACATDPAAARPQLGREVLRTRRMILRRLVNGDIDDLRRLDGDPRVTELLLDRPVRSLADALALVAYANAVYRQHPGLGIWHARDKRDRFLGHFSLMPVSWSRDVEIGVKLVPEAWGRHFALEGGRALCRHAFDALGLKCLVGLCHPENRVVPLLLRRLGFDACGVTVHFEKPALLFRLNAAGR